MVNVFFKQKKDNPFLKHLTAICQKIYTDVQNLQHKYVGLFEQIPKQFNFHKKFRH